MNRKDVVGDTDELIEAALWLSDSFEPSRLEAGPALGLFYVGDLERDPISGSLSRSGKYTHVLAIDEARNASPPGSLTCGAFKSLVAGESKEDRKLMRRLWPKGPDGRRWNRGTLKSVLSSLHLKLKRTLKAPKTKDDERPAVWDAIVRIESLAKPQEKPQIETHRPPASDMDPDRMSHGNVESETQRTAASDMGDQGMSHKPPRARDLQSSSSDSTKREEKKESQPRSGLAPRSPAPLLPGVEETPEDEGQARASRRAKMRQDVEAVWEVFTRHYPRWWTDILRKPKAPRIPSLTKSNAELIAVHLRDDKTVDEIIESLHGVRNNAFHLGRKNGKPRLTPADVFKKNGKIDAVAVNLDKISPDRELNQLGWG